MALQRRSPRPAEVAGRPLARHATLPVAQLMAKLAVVACLAAAPPVLPAMAGAIPKVMAKDAYSTVPAKGPPDIDSKNAAASMRGPAAGTYALPVIRAVPSGRVLDLEARERSLADFTTGKITLLSFMYSYCADPVGCPLVYNTFNALRGRLLAKPDLARRIRFVSLSFDPGHDTPETLRLYAGNLAATNNPLRWDFLTTASLARLKPILDGLGQDVRLQSGPDGLPGRFFYHLVKVFLIDARGYVREIYSTAFLQPDMMYNDLLTLVMEAQRGQLPSRPPMPR